MVAVHSISRWVRIAIARMHERKGIRHGGMHTHAPSANGIRCAACVPVVCCPCSVGAMTLAAPHVRSVSITSCRIVVMHG